MKRAEFIERWLEALESGKYKQAKGVLRKAKPKSEFAYCCLGVACELANQITPMNFDFDDHDDWDEVLPKKLAKFMGIQTNGYFKTGILHRGKRYYTLTELNDDGIRFPTITKIIRKQLAANNFDKAG